MTALYWPDLDCTPATRRIEHIDVIHEHFDSEEDACRAFLAFMLISLDEYHAGRRYRCIHGPGGLVRGVSY